MFLSKLTQENLIEILKNVNDDIYLYGAGKFGKVLGRFLDENKIKWCGFIESKKNDSDNIYTPDDIDIEDCFIIVSVVFFDDSAEIYQKLLNLKIDEDKFIIFEDSTLFNQLYEKYYKCSELCKDISVFKDKHFGERCFVIGNGPSLRKEDLERLKNEYTFGSNDIFMSYDKVDWRASYYVVSDPTEIQVRFFDAEQVKKVASESFAFFAISSSKNMRLYKNTCQIKN